MDNLEKLENNVKENFKAFVSTELENSKSVIFHSAYKILFYQELYDYFLAMCSQDDEHNGYVEPLLSLGFEVLDKIWVYTLNVYDSVNFLNPDAVDDVIDDFVTDMTSGLIDV